MKLLVCLQQSEEQELVPGHARLRPRAHELRLRAGLQLPRPPGAHADLGPAAAARRRAGQLVRGMTSCVDDSLKLCSVRVTSSLSRLTSGQRPDVSLLSDDVTQLVHVRSETCCRDSSVNTDLSPSTLTMYFSDLGGFSLCI